MFVGWPTFHWAMFAMSQRSFDFLMTMFQVIGGGVIGGLIA